MTSPDPTNKNLATEAQFSTFKIAGRLYGIDVTQVQEIVRFMPMTEIPLAPSYVRGLINLRGQVATAIGLRELFQISEDPPSDFMNVVCKIDGSLISFQVDEICDVVYASQNDFEPTPQTISEKIRCYMDGVYKIGEDLLSILNINLITQHLASQGKKAA